MSVIQTYKNIIDDIVTLFSLSGYKWVYTHKYIVERLCKNVEFYRTMDINLSIREQWHFCKINCNLLDLLDDCDKFLRDMEKFKITHGKINDMLCNEFSFSFLCWIKRPMVSEMHKLPQLKKDIWEALREKNRKMYLILVAEDNDLQRESENDCLDYISRTIVKCENAFNIRMKDEAKTRKQEEHKHMNTIFSVIKSFNEITSDYRNDGLHLIIQQVVFSKDTDVVAEWIEDVFGVVFSKDTDNVAKWIDDVFNHVFSEDTAVVAKWIENNFH